MAIITATSVAENLSGTSEADQFVFGIGTSLSTAPDTILNWQPGDTIDLSALGLTAADIEVRTLSGGAIIKLIQGFGATDFQLKIETNGIDAQTILDSIVYDDVPPLGNLPPTPQNDSLSVDIDTAGVVNVLTNDTDPNDDVLTVTGNTVAANGTVVDLGNGQFQYTPNTGFVGADSFTYTVQDPLGETAIATVQVTITDPSGVNVITATSSTQRLIATPQVDRFVFNPGTSTTNAIDTIVGWQPGDTIDLTGLSITAADLEVRQLSSGAIVKLVQGFGATDFQLKIQTNGFSSQAILDSIIYDGGPPIGNLAPSAVNDVLSVAQNTAGAVNVLTNDTDPNNDALTVASFTQATNGSVQDLGNGVLQYTPNSIFTGSDSFSYTIQDPDGLTSTASVSVNVAGTGGLNVINATAPAESLNGTSQQDLFVFTPGTSIVGAVDNLFNWQPGDGIDLSALGLTAANIEVRIIDGGGTIKLIEGFSAGDFQLRISTNGYDTNSILSSIIYDGTPPPLTYGSLTLDGDLADWDVSDRLDDAASGAAGHAFYGSHQGGAFVFALQTDGAAIGANTTIWLNTDLDTATGFLVFGNSVGAEYNINFNADGSASLYSGDAGQTLVSANLDVRYSADGTIAEIAVASNLLNGTPTSANVYADINNSVFVPNSYADASFIVSAPALPVVYGDLTLDGNLSEWAATDRLDDATSGVAGHAFYGAYEADAFVFALQTDGAPIGANTTVWLNTDLDTATGFQVFGSGVGAEYNINFGADGTASLYTGGPGATLVASGLDVRYSADGTIAEFAVASSLLNGATSANVYADVNDAVFLPNSYANTSLIVSAPLSPVTYGDLTLDGSLSDWVATDRLDDAASGVAGHAFYGAYEADAFVFALQTDGAAIGANTTVWLNTDLNTATGYQVFGSGVGAEYNINFDANGTASLYTGAAGETLVASGLDVRYSADGTIAEFAVAANLLNGAASANVYADVNDAVFLPNSYANSSFVVRNDVPPPVQDAKKIAIVYSETTSANSFSDTAYSQLFMSAQAQAMQAGIPYDIITEADLTDAALLGQYASIVFPSFSHVPAALVTGITSALLTATVENGVGLIAGGDFMTNDETGAALSGNAYQRMVDLFGVTAEGFGTTNGLDLVTTDNTHPVSDEYAANELVESYGVPSFSHYMDVTGTGQVLFSQTVNGGAETHDAVIATTTNGRNVHFASDAILGNSNILQDAIGWSVNGAAPSVSLQMTRGNGLFASRNDMDQSQETFDVSDSNPGIYDVLIPMLEDWYTQYDFVGSYYVNVGNNPPDQTTDWAISRPYYEAILALESEIGSHSYTHPENTNLLTPTEIQFEFEQSIAEISAQLGIPILGVAIPGAPEILPTSLEILQYVDTYLSGGYSSEGAGFPNAFGYLTAAAQDAIFLAPNMSFDFTLIEFQGNTAAQAELIWAAEYDDLASHAETPIFLFPWHDYGPTNWNTDPGNGNAPGYTREMFENVIARAYADGMEFVTLLDLSQRMAAFEAASLDVQTTATGFLVTVGSSDAGHFALSVDEGQIIQNVGNWYAFSETDVFLPATGGQFAITTGTASDDVTHIVSLPMRADLISVAGNGTDLNFTVTGSGDVDVELATWGSNSIVVTEVDGASLTGDTLTLQLAATESHTVSLNYIANTIVSGSAGNDAIVVGAGNQTVTAGQGDDAVISAAGSDTFVFGAGDGQDTLTETDATSSASDTLQLGVLAPADAVLTQEGNDLVVTLTATGDSVRIIDQFVSTTAGLGIESLSFAGGTVWDRATIASNTQPPANAEEQIIEKVTAVMEAFGQSSSPLPIDQQDSGASDFELGFLETSGGTKFVDFGAFVETHDGLPQFLSDDSQWSHDYDWFIA